MCGNCYFTICGEKIYIEDVRKPSKIDGFGDLTIAYEINHKEIMRFYVRECVEDKEIRKQLFNVLRRTDYVKPFVEALRSMDLYEDFDMVCGDIYMQMFEEWAERRKLDFRRGSFSRKPVDNPRKIP